MRIGSWELLCRPVGAWRVEDRVTRDSHRVSEFLSLGRSSHGMLTFATWHFSDSFGSPVAPAPSGFSCAVAGIAWWRAGWSRLTGGQRRKGFHDSTGVSYRERGGGGWWLDGAGCDGAGFAASEHRLYSLTRYRAVPPVFGHQKWPTNCHHNWPTCCDRDDKIPGWTGDAKSPPEPSCNLSPLSEPHTRIPPHPRASDASKRQACSATLASASPFSTNILSKVKRSCWGADPG